MPTFQTLVGGGQHIKANQATRSNELRKRKIDAITDDADGTLVAQDDFRAGQQFWMVQWRLPQMKKHKTWDGDGVLHLQKGTGTLYNMEGGKIAGGKPDPDGACVGTFVKLGGKEMEIDCPVSKDDFLSGKVFGKGTFGVQHADVQTLTRNTMPALKKKFVAPFKPVSANALPQRDVHAGDMKIPKQSQTDRDDENIDTSTVNRTSMENVRLTKYWSAHWRKFQGKKHKTWDGDSFVIEAAEKLTMISDDGKMMGVSKAKGTPLFSGLKITIAGKTVEIDSEVSKLEVPRATGSMPFDVQTDDDVVEETMVIDCTQDEPVPITFAAKNQVSTPLLRLSTTVSEGATKKFVAPTNFYSVPTTTEKGPAPLHDPNAAGAIVMKAPSKYHEKLFNIKNRPVVPVVIDPLLARHLRPHQIEGVKFMYECVMGLRKHEGQGCILADEMGMGKTLQTITLIWTLLRQNCYSTGSQATTGSGAVGKALIVCPVTLIANWKNEFHKWLGKDRVGVFTGDKDNATIKQFINSRIHQVLVIGYERLRKVVDELAYCMPPISLIVCDEGHRLKGGKSKTVEMFRALRTPRRVILSGTPIQNDLSEFHAMADFCNPGLLDSYSSFKKIFEIPILNSRAPGCSVKQKELGEARHEQLQQVAQSFVLRREANILSKYLPPKHEYVVFVTPTTLQSAIFTRILQPDALSALLTDSMARSLAMIRKLTKISTSPMLLKNSTEKATRAEDEDEEALDADEEVLRMLPQDTMPGDVEVSGKLILLSKILKYLREETDEKCVVVSHYTATLNIIEQICKKRRYTSLRLDGSTPTAQRQDFVNKFNRAPQSGAFLFLLSSKAGGVGLNLVGASRLVLIDSDWNPSHDLQSMARIHRDGQKRPVYIYRFLTTGTIDEKIYQRQVTKLGLSDSLMKKATTGSSKSKSDSFTHKELRDLFTFHRNTSCHTHALLGCLCVLEQGRSENAEVGNVDMLSEKDKEALDPDSDSDIEFPTTLMTFQPASLHKDTDFEKLNNKFAKKKKAELASLGEWTHIDCVRPSERRSEILDGALQAMLGQQFTASSTPGDDESEDSIHSMPSDTSGGSISFLFEKCSNSSTEVTSEDNK